MILTLILVGLLVPVGRFWSLHSQAYRHRASTKDEKPPPEVGIAADVFAISGMVYFIFLLAVVAIIVAAII